ncbi:hypothetical protein D3C87_1394800 [compost metagenome]
MAVSLEVAVAAAVAEVEIQAAYRRALGERQTHFGLIALWQQAHVVIQIDLVRSPCGRIHDQ